VARGDDPAIGSGEDDADVGRSDEASGGAEDGTRTTENQSRVLTNEIAR
jgi:hypothetical protein